MINICIVEDDLAYLNLLRQHVQSCSDIKLLFTAPSLGKLISFYPLPTALDLICLDTVLGDKNALAFLPRIRRVYPVTDILIMSDSTDKDEVLSAFRQEVNGYYVKGSSLTEYIKAIRHIHAGHSYVDPIVATHLVKSLKVPTRVLIGKFQLTRKEQEVAQGLADGLSYKLIASRLGTSINTIRQHVRHVYKKLNINSRQDLLELLNKINNT